MYDEKRRRSEMNTAIRMGREEGRAEGIKEAKFDDARNLKHLGVDVQIISQAVGLSVEEIENL